MRHALTLALTIGIIVVMHSLGWGQETRDLEPTKPPLVRRLPYSDIANPVIQRIDSLTWEDEIIKQQISLLPEETRAELADANEEQRRGHLNRARNQIKLKYVDEGGAVLPVFGEPTPWVNTPPQPIVSLGLLPCYGDMEEAKEVATKTGKPILKVYTELPGCSACVGHGHNQLSHPLIVDAAMEFVPVVVSGGWPHLVVLDADEEPLSEKVTHLTSVGETLQMMRDGLRKAGRDVPEWLDLVTDEYNAKRETTAFAMGCFWSGERKLGGLDGVLSTRVGGREGRGEWVEVKFNPDVISYEELVKAASEMGCTSAIVARTDKQAEIAKDYVSQPERLYRDDQSLINPPKNPSADKHSIYNSKRYGNLPMTPGQATRINAQGKNAEKYFSPSQLILAQKLEELDTGGSEVRELGPKPDWSSIDHFDSDARNLQAKLGMSPKRIW